MIEISEFIEEDLIKAITTLKSSRAPGLDIIPGNILKLMKGKKIGIFKNTAEQSKASPLR